MCHQQRNRRRVKSIVRIRPLRCSVLTFLVLSKLLLQSVLVHLASLAVYVFFKLFINLLIGSTSLLIKQHRLAPPLSKPGSSKLRSTPTPSVASHSSLPSQSKKSHSRSRSPSQRSDSSEDSHYNSRSNASSVGSRAGFSPTLPSAESIGRNANRNKAATGKVTGTGPPIKRAPPTLPRIPSPPRTVPPPAPAPVPQRRAVDTSTYFVGTYISCIMHTFLPNVHYFSRY